MAASHAQTIMVSAINPNKRPPPLIALISPLGFPPALAPLHSMSHLMWADHLTDSPP